MFEHWAHTDLTRLPDIKKMGNVFSQDSEANKIGVEVTKDGVPVNLVGMVKAWIVKPDGEMITEQQNVGMSGNTAWVILPDEAYDKVGLLGMDSYFFACRCAVRGVSDGIVRCKGG